MKERLPKLIVILGPTASGKSAWVLKLAHEFGGEIVSADSRQIYRGLDIGTAKPSGQRKTIKGKSYLLVQGVPHHLIDIVKPNQTLTLAQYQTKAIRVIRAIIKRGRTPFLVGGTGLYLSSVIDHWQIPKIKPQKNLRKQLERLSTKKLISKLKTIDPETAAVIDLSNRRRLIRALEVNLTSGSSFLSQRQKGEPLFEVLELGLLRPRGKLYQAIDRRVDAMIKRGLVGEVRKLLVQGYNLGQPALSGIGYQQIGQHLQGKIDLETAIRLIKRDTRHYAKRQLTWFRRDQRIKWLSNFGEARKLVKKFIK